MCVYVGIGSKEADLTLDILPRPCAKGNICLIQLVVMLFHGNDGILTIKHYAILTVIK